MPDFDIAFNSFFKGCEAIVLKNHYKAPTLLRAPWLEIDPGNARTRYVRIWQCDDWNMEACTLNGHPQDGIKKRVYTFVDRTNGDVLKPATWRAPAKHARGNIFDSSNGLEKMGPYGPAYLT